MAKIIASNADFKIAQDADTSAVTVTVRADKIPNQYGYGFTRENGNITRTYGRMMARKYLTPAQGTQLRLSPAIDAFMVGSDLWRTYIVTGAAL